MVWLEMVCRQMECDTDREKALKEHINILDCLQREWSEAEQCVRKRSHIVYVCERKETCLWEG